MSDFHKACHEYNNHWFKIARVIESEIWGRQRSSTREPVAIQIERGFTHPNLATLFIQNNGDKIFKVKPVKGHINGVVMPFPMFDINFTVGWHLGKFTITRDQALFETDWLYVGYRLKHERNFTFQSFSIGALNDQINENSGKEFIANKIAQSITDRSFELYYEYKWLYLMAGYVAGYPGGALKLLDEMNIEPKRNYRYPKNKVFALIDQCVDKYSRINPLRIAL